MSTPDNNSKIQLLETSIADLESRLEFQDQTITTLNDELVVHQRSIAKLEKQLALVLTRLPDKEAPDQDPKSEPPPPHY